MAKIINLQVLKKEILSIKNAARMIVLVGGCFDILHVGHVKFLREAKASGSFLFLLLESDETVAKLKGKNRPYFPQKDRAEVLSSIKYVDYIVLMPPKKQDALYENLISQIKPNIIAVTENDPILEKKRNQAIMVGGKLKIIPYIKTFSSSEIAKLLGIE